MAAKLIHKCSVFCRRPIVAFILGSFASEIITFPFVHVLWDIWPLSVFSEWIHHLVK